MTAKVVFLAAERPSAKDAAEVLLEMALRAEKGEIVAVSVVYELQDGDTGNWHSLAGSRSKMAGALMNAAMRRLGFESD